MSLIQEGGTLNALDVSPTPIVPGTIGVTNKAEGEVGGRLMTKDAQLKVNDGIYDRVLVGQRADGSYGIQVSKPGFGVTSGNSNLVMNSDFNSFKIVASGTATVVSTVFAWGGFQVDSATITHGLGYTPAIIAFVTSGTTYTAVPDIIQESLTSGAGGSYWKASADVAANSTQVQLLIKQMGMYWGATPPGSAGNGLSWNFKYYLLQETAN